MKKSKLNKKRFLAKLILFAIAIVFVVLIIIKIKETESDKVTIDKFPLFHISNIWSGELLTSHDLLNENILLVNLFNSECEFCTHEIKDFIKNMNSFPSTSFVLLSEENRYILQKFSNEFELDSIPNMKVYHSEYDSLVKGFGQISLPTTFVFDQNQDLILKYKGQIRASILADSINSYRDIKNSN